MKTKKPAKKAAKRVARKPKSTPVIQGWKCPCCGTGNAPDVKQCPCVQKKKESEEEARRRTFRDYLEEARKAREDDRYRRPFSPWPPREVPQWPTAPYRPHPDVWC